MALEQHELDTAIAAVQQSLASHGLMSEWTSFLSGRLRVLNENSVEGRKVLERHGWSGNQFRSPPDLKRLLRDLRDLATSLTISPSVYQVPGDGLLSDDGAVQRAEERRFERSYLLEDKPPVGEGTYGAVYRARCLSTQRIVAVKRVKMEHEDEGVPSTALREVAVLKQADHPNVVRLLDVVCTLGRLHLIFEFVDQNLKQHMKRHSLRLEPHAVRDLQHQLMKGIDYCHSRRIIHRDLKPQNILIETGDVLKIADFGMARAFCVPIPKYTHEVVTTWYRAPEILFGSEEYSLPVDVWSAGCILGEIGTGAALFHGDSEIDTIFQIFRKLGTPTKDEWPGINDLPDFKPTFPKWQKRPWSEIRNTVAQLGVSGAQLLDDMLRYDPKCRISAKQSLLHPYFAAPHASSSADAAIVAMSD